MGFSMDVDTYALLELIVSRLVRVQAVMVILRDRESGLLWVCIVYSPGRGWVVEALATATLDWSHEFVHDLATAKHNSAVRKPYGEKPYRGCVQK